METALLTISYIIVKILTLNFFLVKRVCDIYVQIIFIRDVSIYFYKLLIKKNTVIYF